MRALAAVPTTLNPGAASSLTTLAPGQPVQDAFGQVLIIAHLFEQRPHHPHPVGLGIVGEVPEVLVSRPRKVNRNAHHPLRLGARPPPPPRLFLAPLDRGRPAMTSPSPVVIRRRVRPRLRPRRGRLTCQTARELLEAVRGASLYPIWPLPGSWAIRVSY